MIRSKYSCFLLEQLMNEYLRDNGDTLWQSRNVRHKAAGRAFDLPHGRVKYAPNGRREAQLILQQYRKRSKDFQVSTNRPRPHTFNGEDTSG